MTEKEPRNFTYKDYRAEVQAAAEAAVTDYGDVETEDDLHDAVEYAVQGTQMITSHGFMLMTVMLSDQSPDVPDYTMPWDQYVNLTGDDVTWSDCVSQMAYVCFYSDVYEKAKELFKDNTGED